MPADTDIEVETIHATRIADRRDIKDFAHLTA